MRIYAGVALRAGRIDGQAPGPHAVAPAEWAQRVRRCGIAWGHAVDLDAAAGGHSQWSVAARLLGHGVRVQFAGGVRSMTQVQQLLDLGIERVVVGTQALRNPQWLHELARVFPSRILLGLDEQGTDLLVDGRRGALPGPAPAAAAAAQRGAPGLAGILLRQADRERCDAAAVRRVHEAAPGLPVVAWAGAPDAAAAAALGAAGAAGVVVEAGPFEEEGSLAALVRAHPQAAEPLPARRAPAAAGKPVAGLAYQDEGPDGDESQDDEEADEP